MSSRGTGINVNAAAYSVTNGAVRHRLTRTLTTNSPYPLSYLIVLL